MDDQAARVAKVGDMAEQFHIVDQLDAGVIAALQREGEEGPSPLWDDLLGPLVVGLDFSPA